MTNQKIDLGWNFDNSYTYLPASFYSRVEPALVPAPKLVKLNESLASDFGLNIDALKSQEGVDILSGNKIPEGAKPIAQAYAGHQFGYFTMLGDGCAILIGEHITPRGERFDIQLKGSGLTPYSRSGDGKAVLGPMLREYIISEAMHALGIPTSRSLGVVTTGESIYRQTFQPGAVLTRVAASQIRVGTFQYVYAWDSRENLRILADYTIKRHYPDIADEPDSYLLFLRETIKRQAFLISKWMLVGFIHGVMNTDNVAISGETIDYGPCAFMDIYDPDTVFSSIDIYGRYAYSNQPAIAQWNLTRFAETLLSLLHEDKDKAYKMVEDEVSQFSSIYKENWISGMRAKLGLFNKETGDESLIESLLNMMHAHKADFTNTFRALTLGAPQETALADVPEFNQWLEKWQERQKRQRESKEAIRELMKKSNPAVIPRNHRVEAALEAAAEREDFSIMEELLEVISEPYAYSEKQAEYAKLPETPDCQYRTFCGT